MSTLPDNYWDEQLFNKLFYEELNLVKKFFPTNIEKEPPKKKITLEEYWKRRAAKEPVHNKEKKIQKRKRKRGGRKARLREITKQLKDQLDNINTTPNYGRAKETIEKYK